VAPVAPGDIRAELADPRALVWMLVLGEALTPRGDLGPLARFWVPAAPRRRTGPEEAPAMPADG
jgi:hypothetical protein